MSRTVTCQGLSYEIETGEPVRFLLGLEKRRRKGGSVAHWEKLAPLSEYPDFAASGKVEDLLPVSLAERMEDPTTGATYQNSWGLLLRAVLSNQGRLELHFAYSLPASKCWPLERCLIGLGWRQIY